jgi:spore coat polysaccharide biosynthesis protein SpsF
VTALVLQARLDSTRLPGKSLFPLGEKPLISRVMEAFISFPVETKILACPEDSVSSFVSLAEEAHFSVIPGSKEDVLARYCHAIRESGADRIIRATGDNPFVFIDAAAALDSEADADYACFFGLPCGAGVEIINSEALLKAEKEAKDPWEREHVCPYLYNHPELFRLHRPLAPNCWQAPELRVTVDTREDYDRALALYGHLLSLPLEERNKGENIIAACKQIFA